MEQLVLDVKALAIELATNWWPRKVYLKLGRKTRKGVAACSQRGLILVPLRARDAATCLSAGLCGDVAFPCEVMCRLGWPVTGALVPGP